MIEIKHLKKEYSNAIPLKDVSTVINDGDIISVIGPSGTGKSTLLRCINLLEKPTAGEIYVDNECITASGCNIDNVRKKLGMVFQNFNLFEHLMIIENIMVPQIDLLKRSRDEAEKKAKELLKLVGLLDKAYNFPAELSGGQKQRAAIARTLAMDPEIILFDEPTSALDPTMVGEVKSVIRDLAQSGKTMMIVTHEMDFAKSICNRVFYLDEGTIYEDGSKEDIFENPKREKTRRFIYRLSSLEMNIENENFDFRKAISDIEEFGHKTELAPRRIGKLQIAFEELCIISLLKKNENPSGKIMIEYSKKTDELKLTVFYPENIRLEISKLSSLMLDSATDSLLSEPGKIVAVIGGEK